MTSRLLLNQDRSAAVDANPPSGVAVGPGPSVRDFHRRLPGYTPSPLYELPELAAACNVGRVLVKAEVERMGLPSFKLLGASWATYRLLRRELQAAGVSADADWSTIDELADVVAQHLGTLRLVSATDGNHGRAVARMARWCRLAATILVPDGTADARIDGIASEGADVEVVDGTYDDAVVAAAALATDGSASERRLVVSDTSWAGYEEVPCWVIEGYSTIFAELDEQLAEWGMDRLDIVVVPLGVGALGAAATASVRGPRLVGVEPDTAACVAAAVEAGKVVEVPGPHRSIMAGLNCGLASRIALPLIATGFDAFVAVDDDRCRDAIRALAESGLDVGETGAAALAGLTALVEEHSTELPLSPQATVLLLATEGVTDPAAFEAIVHRPPGPSAGTRA